jgi:hypothetical protein
MANGNNGGDLRLYDGQLDFSGGINAGKVTTIASQNFPNGLRRDQLSWLNNATVRGGGITQRTTWKPVIQNVSWPGLFQGAFMHRPDFADPHILLAIGGKLYAARVDTDNSVEALSDSFGLFMPATEPQSYFAQAEQFTVWQCGDLVTNPIFYWRDNAGNAQMRRSNGFIGIANAGNEIPPAGPMDYHANRLWYAIGRRYIAGDIVNNHTSGTAPFIWRDSVLKVTENPIANAGDGFSTPTNTGNIRALKHTSFLDTSLGQSPLFVFTRNTVYLCDAPVTRTDWTAAGYDKMPLQRIALAQGGTYAERSVVPVNDDLFFNSAPNGDIRSMEMSVRNFHELGNVPISRNENRILRFNDRALLRFASGMQFDNRLWQTTLPVSTPVGTAFRAIMPLDFDIISTLEERLPPAWEGMYEGLQILQILEGDFGGLQRAFAIVVSQITGNIDIWEFTQYDRFENGDNRVTWVIEFPAYTWGNPNGLKELTGGSLWVDKLFGTVEFILQYRPDQHPCWIDWHAWKQCAARDCSEDPDSISCPQYPSQPYCEEFEPDMEFPVPPVVCVRKSRPSNIGFQFQCRLIIKGWTRVRGFLLHAQPRWKGPYQNIVC